MNRPPDMLIHSRERLAWTAVLISFVIFCAIAISAPLLLRAYIQDSTQFLTVNLQANEGTVSVNEANTPPRAALSGEPPQPVSPDALILTDSTASGLVLVSDPQTEELLARVQLYSATVMRIQEASTPRFGLSSHPDTLLLDLTSGRIRVVVGEDRKRPFAITLTTPHGEIIIDEPGEYSLNANNDETQVTVQQGQLTVSAQEQSIQLNTAERAEIARNTPPIGPLTPERNLVENGSFGNRWEKWQQYAWEVELTDQPAGDIQILNISGEAGLHIVRTGEGHADVGIRQIINQDVTDFNSLLLEVDLRILGQTLAVCGNVGSECPIIIRLEYDDINGNAQVWQRGFYANGDINPDSTPDVCLTCPPPRLEHVKITPGQFSFYQSDLIEDLQLYGFLPPRRIKNISIIASGHSFEIELLDIALIVGEEVLTSTQ
ncbi:MAG: FecR domain-containing protein [Chloroflexota bacterium]|nr:FecR domain-containing protein [Anaerolineales bacterium]MCA9974121.1 FecR domain-containing protein [Anaerolineales bacterium]MCB8966531.1 FecR domain-containing protein [Ardenticatenaceae bacterium]